MGGFGEDLKAKFKEGKFKTYARWGGLICVLGLFLTCVFKIVSMCLINCLLAMFVSIAIGVIELPFCCTCFEWCRHLAVTLRVFEKYAFRGMLYFVVGFGVVCLVFMQKSRECWFLSFWGACIMLDGLCYVVAHCRGEKWEDEDGQAEGLGINSKKVKTAAATKAMGIV